jgi:hypothetical protein
MEGRPKGLTRKWIYRAATTIKISTVLINLRTSFSALRLVSLPSLSVLSILILVSQRLYNDFFGGLGYRSVLVMVAAGGSVTSSGES